MLQAMGRLFLSNKSRTKIWKPLAKLLSPRVKLGRKGFAIIFILAIILLQLFVEIAWQLWFLYDPYPYWKFNISLNLSTILSEIGIIIGILPLVALVLIDCTLSSYTWGYEVGYGFLIECIIVDFLFIIYVIQCIKRSLDLGHGWSYILKPLYNPYALLFAKSKLTDE